MEDFAGAAGASGVEGHPEGFGGRVTNRGGAVAMGITLDGDNSRGSFRVAIRGILLEADTVCMRPDVESALENVLERVLRVGVKVAILD